ncbi:MAG: rhomboid family intramembrane serine protease [Defluviitaleaceae bacterium]|nr:rhomboid family intramembrane serine protease [Defluviitaleaceae bacterium]
MPHRLHYNAPVILTYTILAFAATMLIAFQPEIATAIFAVYRSPLDPLFVLRLFTHVLGHINIEHFTGNFMLILLIGPMLEEKYGSRTILIMIVITAFVTGFINVLLFESALMGASGVAFSFIIISSMVNLREGSIPLTFVLVVMLYIGREIHAAFAITHTNISHLTHIVGGVCGAVIGLYLARTKPKKI